MKSLFAEENYEAAAELADTINWNKIKNVNVVTSGYSEAFSSGLLIGTIIDVKKENYGISNTIKIRPSANFNNINIVTVIKGDNND